MKLQQTKEYLLLIDEEAEINEKPYFIWKDEVHKFHSDSGYGIKTWTDYNEEDGSSLLVNWSNKRKGSIVAYYPLTKEAKGLDLPLLPNPFMGKSLGRIIKEAFGDEPMDKDEENLRYYWGKGYAAGKLAQSDKQFSLDDIKEAIAFGYNSGYYHGRDKSDYKRPDSGTDFETFTQSLSTQQLPKEFMPEMATEYEKTDHCIHCHSLLLSGGIYCHHCGEEAHKVHTVIKIITNPEGKKELAGTYKY